LDGKIEQRMGLEKATLVPSRYRKKHGLFHAEHDLFIGFRTAQRIMR
jgi:hypothetical protein